MFCGELLFSISGSKADTLKMHPSGMVSSIIVAFLPISSKTGGLSLTFVMAMKTFV